MNVPIEIITKIISYIPKKKMLSLQQTNFYIRYCYFT